MKSKHPFLTILLALALLPAVQAAERPNVVVFLADDMGYGDLGYHDNRQVATPQLDAFAREAVEFTNFHVSPVCSPTRASLLTGRYPTGKIYGMIRSVDDNFGRLRAVLQELGLEQNTLLVFTSDNGPCSGSRPVDRHMAGLHGLKGTVYENGIRVPCFMRWPAGFASPARVTRLAAHIDLLPTVMAACGGAADSGPTLDGSSLLPLLRDPSAGWPDRTLFFQWDSGQVPRRGHAFAVVTEKWKLVQPCGMDAPNQQHIRNRYAELCRLQGRGERSIDGPPRHELYDLAADPGETTDLAGSHREIVDRMTKQYETWFADVTRRWAKDPAPQQEPKHKGPR